MECKDIDETTKQILHQKVSELISERTSSNNIYSLEDLAISYKEISNGLVTEDDVLKIAKNISREQEFENQRKRQNKIKRRKFIRGMGIGGFFLGITLGSGLAVFKILTGHIAQELNENYQQKIKELNNRFYGPLTSLLEINDKSTLTTLERELYIDAFFGRNLIPSIRDNNSIIYNQEFEKMILTVKKGKIESGNSYITKILLTKRNLKNQIFEICHYRDLENPSIEKSLIFLEGTKIRYTDFNEKKSYTIKDNIEKHVTDKIDAYKENITSQLKEFYKLFSRGPNASANLSN